jgi:MYXO-CTERM domain-containing protein
MRLFAFALAATSALVALPRPASACSLATNDLWIQNPAHASDTTAPSRPAIGAVEVTRHFEDEQSGCGRNVSSCGSFGTMEINVSATDDRAQAQDIGYEVRIVGGNAPDAFDPTREGRVRPFFGEGRMIFFFDVDSPDFSVDLEIRAVDGNGNVGDPIVVTVTDEQPESSSGCAAGKQGSLVGFGLIAFATALALRRRRR